MLGIGSLRAFCLEQKTLDPICGCSVWVTAQSSEFIAGDHPLGRDPEFLIGHSVSPCHPGSLTLRIGVNTNGPRALRSLKLYYFFLTTQSI